MDQNPVQLYLIHIIFKIKNAIIIINYADTHSPALPHPFPLLFPAAIDNHPLNIPFNISVIPEFNSNLKLYGIIHTSHVLIGFSRLFFFTHF